MQFAKSSVGVGPRKDPVENRVEAREVVLLFSMEKQASRERKEEGKRDLNRWPCLYLQGQ